MDLVDDVDLPASGRPESARDDQFAHGVDAVVRCGVELVDVEGGPRAISMQDSQIAAGLAVDRCAQLRALARMRAVEVLPVPRGPLKR